MKRTHNTSLNSFFIGLILITASTPLFSQKLTLLWETPATLPGVESVIYDPEAQMIYSANINGHFMAKDGNGSIAQISLDGEVLNANWITGLDAPTGLGIHKGKLYVTDIDRLVEIDIAQGEISKTWPIAGAKALNDIATGSDGTVYASDTGGDAVYALKNGVVSKVLDNVRGPNGLFATETRFLTVLWYAKTLYTVNLATQQLTEVTTGITNPDGIEAIENGDLILTGLNGLIYHVNANGVKTLMADTSGEGIQAADIDYVASKKLLLVPTLNSNKVMAYRLDF